MAKLSSADLNTIPLWQQVATAVRRAIQNGELHPGDRVVESQLSADMGISRNPIREGLRQLQQKGILEYRANAGTVVAELAPSEALVMMKTREYMETFAVELYFAKGKRSSLHELEDILARMEVAAGADDVETCEELDEHFHTALIALSGSKVLSRVWEAVDPYTGLAIARPSVGRESVPNLASFISPHRRIVEVLRSGDEDRAKHVIATHLDLVFEEEDQLSVSDRSKEAVDCCGKEEVK